MPIIDQPLFHPAKPLYWQFLNAQFKTMFNSYHHRLVVGLVAATIFITGSAFLMSKMAARVDGPQAFPSKASTTAVLGESTAVSSHPPSLAPIIPTLSPAAAGPAYYLSLSAKPALATYAGVLVADVLVQALNLPLVAGQPYPISHLRYDISEGNPLSGSLKSQFNFNYYAVIPGLLNLSQKQLYDSGLIRVSLEPAGANLLPSLMDTKFCTQDSECLIRVSQCRLGAFNRFEPLTDAYRCQAIVPEQTASTSPAPNCPNPEIVSGSTRCAANRCQAELNLKCPE
jgi:hypothetical protein